ncbi:Ribosome biogenesis GTPase A [Eubacterium plexicaudatum ASF492]|nr:Ribosome biogenesis GTPase A [Eubacterium plexicaudatum ASF492]
MKEVHARIQEACKDKLERNRRRGIINRPVRAMVAGIPNVGKSTFINSFAGKACAKTGNKPGVTKGKQWIRLNKNVELLDTPGILWPKFEDQTIGLHLAWIGSIKDELLNKEELAWELSAELMRQYPGILAGRYDLEEQTDTAAFFRQLALNRNCLKKGGEPDDERAAALLLEEFRSGKLGGITIEAPPAESKGS